MSKFYKPYYRWVSFVPFDLMAESRAVDAAIGWFNTDAKELIELSPNDLMVYAHIFEQCRDSFKEQKGKKAPGECHCYHSATLIGRFLRLDRKTVERSLCRLIKAGLIVREICKLRGEDGRIATITKLRPSSYEEWLSLPIERYTRKDPNPWQNDKGTPKDTQK